ncbi:hypothetical protein ULMS_19530 [Patiriisocius marinistellae]|uniref:HNH nuclease domain-containing protein n=1 Tax=Patiriisocius marinistellae TaxID=2494560 RepID=A0A5J4G1T0_9FLAO|nr:hypothetical protein [Patiriisocius marinistellae]GEQ86445.1 hypothetical protein ULMS_19530 [Patiriisocius marinistellae]
MILITKNTKNPNISVYKKKRWKGLDGNKTTLAIRDFNKSILHYTNPANFKDNKKLTRKGFTYEAYSHKDTKKALKKIFKSKCAYCESFIMHIEPGDIEHFRPKAEVHTKNGEVLIPGYYWLGADWKNLLLSCIKCNRSNNEAINFSDGEIQNMGKANHFPLSDESKRVRLHTEDISIEDEFVQIINPCREDPEAHLIFEDNGQVTAKDEKGEKSIAVYGLFRADLVLKRSQVSRDLSSSLTDLVLIIQQLDQLEAANISTDIILKLLRVNLENLKFAFQIDAEYLALKRQKLKRFIKQNPISNQKLTEMGIPLLNFLNSNTI